MTQRIYLDYNASTPVAAEVFDEMLPYLREKYGNPSSSHSFGVACREGLEKARERVASLLGCSAEELIFLSGATESNNTVIRGVAAASPKGSHIITSRVEHPAVLEPCRHLEKQGYKVTYLDVDGHGMVSPGDFAKALTKKTVLATIMHANNEVGTIQPIAELAMIAALRGVPFHTDAAQSVGKVSCRVGELGVDFLTIAGHKFYAPKGVGALYIKKGRKLAPLLYGAGHERGLRPGTENVPHIVGLGKACDIAAPIIGPVAEKHKALGRKLLDELMSAGFSVHLNGHPETKLPNTWNISFEGFDAPAVMQALEGVAVSPGAACHGASVEPSHVLAAMGVKRELARGAIRFSFGRETTEADIEYVVGLVKGKLRKSRQED